MNFCIILWDIIRSCFISKYRPCPYWNFYQRCCMCTGHNLGFDNTEYCIYSDAITICLHYRRGKNE